MATFAQWVSFGPYFSGGQLCTLRVYHYAAGTTTDKDMYTTRTKSATVAQPLESDSDGIARAYADGLYKIRIDGSTDGVNYTTLYTDDNVAIADQTQTTAGEGAAITSASTLTLGTDGDFFHVSGNTGPITAISGTQTRVTLVFDSTPTLTHSGNIILGDSVDFTAAAGDVLEFINEGSGVWREIGRRLATPALTVRDSVFILKDNSDTTKRAQFQLSGITTGTTRTYTFPDADHTFVTLADQAAVNAMTSTTTAMTPNHNKIVLGTTTATTSGTAINFTSIPAGVRRIIMSLNEVSLSGTAELLVQIGDTDGIENTGYVSTGNVMTQSNTTAGASSTAGFVMRSASASNLTSGLVVITHLGSNLWIAHWVHKNDATVVGAGAGSKTLSAELTQIRLTTSNGSDTFDSGSVNIAYER